MKINHFNFNEQFKTDLHLIVRPDKRRQDRVWRNGNVRAASEGLLRPTPVTGSAVFADAPVVAGHVGPLDYALEKPCGVNKHGTQVFSNFKMP